MTSINDLVDELIELTAWQRTPEELTILEYRKMIINGQKTLYIDTGRAQEFSKDMFVSEQTEDSYGNVTPVQYFIYDLPIDEEKYVLLCAQIAFFKKAQSDVNNIVSYTTDALSITNADKPYAHLQDTIANLENERRIVFYKMTNYSFYQA